MIAALALRLLCAAARMASKDDMALLTKQRGGPNPRPRLAGEGRGRHTSQPRFLPYVLTLEDLKAGCSGDRRHDSHSP